MAAGITAKAGRHRQGEPVTRPTKPPPNQVRAARQAQSAASPLESLARPPESGWPPPGLGPGRPAQTPKGVPPQEGQLSCRPSFAS